MKDANQEKLEAFIKEVNKEDTRCVVAITLTVCPPYYTRQPRT